MNSWLVTGPILTPLLTLPPSGSLRKLLPPLGLAVVVVVVGFVGAPAVVVWAPLVLVIEVTILGGGRYC